MSANIDEPLYLNDTWSYYFHDPINDDWTNSSYMKLMDLSCVDDFWNFHEKIHDNIGKGMFFLMREHIYPCWDDPGNINGGCISIKILKNEMLEFWEKLCASLLTESLLREEHRDKYWNSVNGISTSPKRNFCIVKIWTGNHDLEDLQKFAIPGNYSGEIIYKSNISNISMDNVRVNSKLLTSSAYK